MAVVYELTSEQREMILDLATRYKNLFAIATIQAFDGRGDFFVSVRHHIEYQLNTSIAEYEMTLFHLLRTNNLFNPDLIRFPDHINNSDKVDVNDENVQHALDIFIPAILPILQEVAGIIY